VLDEHLTTRAFAVGESCTIADLSLYAYTRLAGEGGFDLDSLAAVSRWLESIRHLPGYVDDHVPYPENALPGRGRSIYD
jgi:glutathione S-transferase